jgi:hypothetical protein
MPTSFRPSPRRRRRRSRRRMMLTTTTLTAVMMMITTAEEEEAEEEDQDHHVGLLVGRLDPRPFRTTRKGSLKRKRQKWSESLSILVLLNSSIGRQLRWHRSMSPLEDETIVH